MRASVRPADDRGAAPEVDRRRLQGAAGVAGQVGQLERGGRGVFVAPADRLRRVGACPVDQPAPAEVEAEDVGRLLIDFEVLEAFDERFPASLMRTFPNVVRKGRLTSRWIA